MTSNRKFYKKTLEYYPGGRRQTYIITRSTRTTPEGWVIEEPPMLVGYMDKETQECRRLRPPRQLPLDEFQGAEELPQEEAVAWTLAL